MATTATMPAYELPGVPVHQPAHLEGDPTLATEILPGPPSLISAQQSAQKRDPKKPSTMYSYLPATDPGSTYSGVAHGTLIGIEEPRSKRARTDKGASGRAQRASARNQTALSVAAPDAAASNDSASSSGHQPILLDTEPSGSGVAMDDDFVLSRSNSSLNLQDPPLSSTAKPAKRSKGKGKDVGTPPVHVKEEPKSTALHTPEPGANVPNDDFCSSCKSNGALVYCDGCPRAFHFWCLDPPMESIDEGDSSWFCPACVIRKHPPRKPPPSLLAPLIHQLDMSIPVEFQLPDDIRNFFRDVGTSQKGSYVDMQEAKPPRLNRHGQPEERDPHRLRDKNGAPVLCFKCGMSALPVGLASTIPTAKRPRRSTSKAVTPEGYKDMVSCDFCSLHWHLDCLDPPLSAMPPLSKKWMCPNHAERLVPSKRRVPKQNASPIEIARPKQWNNGHIDVIHPEVSAAETRPRVQVDEVLINGRRYRVPEKIIILDFWNKVSKHDLSENRDVEMASGLSSPLTSLSSLEDLDEPSPGSSSPDLEALHAAQALFNLSHCKPAVAPARSIESRPSVDSHHVQKRAVSSEATSRTASTSTAPPPVQPAPAVAGRPSRSAKKAASMKIASAIHAAGLNGETPTPAPSVSVPVRRNRRTVAQPVAAVASTRELRSRSRNHTQDSASSVTSAKTVRTTDSLSLPTAPSQTFRTIVKMEEIDNSFSLFNGLETSSSTTNTQATSKAKRRPKLKDIDEEGRKAEAKSEPKEKRGRKRKVRDDDLPDVTKQAGPEERGVEVKKTKRATKVVSGGRDKAKATPSSRAVPVTPSPATSRLPPLTPLTTTPTLKIRLPRLNSTSKVGASSLPNGNADTPTRL